MNGQDRLISVPGPDGKYPHTQADEAFNKLMEERERVGQTQLNPGSVAINAQVATEAIRAQEAAAQVPTQPKSPESV
jgi:hypothetical protein